MSNYAVSCLCLCVGSLLDLLSRYHWSKRFASLLLVEGGLLFMTGLDLLEDASGSLAFVLVHMSCTDTWSELAENFQAGSFPVNFMAASKAFNSSGISIMIVQKVSELC